MKVNSSVKAGGYDRQHNENLGYDGNANEQKKNFGKRLSLSKETIRELKDSELRRAVGGDRYTAASKQAECCAKA